MNSPYNIYIISCDGLDNYIYNLKRYIDRNKGIPYTFKKEGFNDLINSKALFSRKFDLSVNKEIVDMIFNYFIDK